MNAGPDSPNSSPIAIMPGENDFMEVCEWHNGEGFDVTIGTSQQFSLTQGQWAPCLQALVNYRG